MKEYEYTRLRISKPRYIKLQAICPYCGYENIAFTGEGQYRLILRDVCEHWSGWSDNVFVFRREGEDYP